MNSREENATEEERSPLLLSSSTLASHFLSDISNAIGINKTVEALEQNENLSNFAFALQNGASGKENFSSMNSTILLDDNSSNSLFSDCQEISNLPIVVNLEGSNSRNFNYVYQVLMECGEGDFLIQTYDFEEIPENRKKLLDEKKTTYFSIHKVARIIVHHEIRRTGSYSFEALAESASRLFPLYLKESFYSRASKNNNSHGAFQTCYLKIREKALAMEFMEKSRTGKRKIPEDDESYSEELIDLKKTIAIIDDDFKKKWINTVAEERNYWYLKLDYKSIFQDFPCLLHPVSFTLIQADFCSLFNKKENLLKENWPSIGKNIIKLAQQKKNDKEIRGILKDYNDKTRECSDTFALVLLPLLFRKITKLIKRSKTGKAWNPEKTEVLSSFIYHLKETENTANSLQEIYKKMDEWYAEHKLIIAPFVVICGPSLNQISSAYVVMDSHTYQVTNTLEAVDLCFQCIKVFRKNFSHISCHVWQFLEREAYKFPVQNLFGSVSQVIDKLKQVN